MTGYEVEKARALMAVAYDKAVAAGIYDGTSDIKIDLRVYQSDAIYVNMFNYLNAALKNACVGTPFEGKVEMTMTVDTDYYETMQSGNADMIFTTWGGATMAPFGVFGNCYTDDAYGKGNQNEYGYDTTTIDIVYNVEGVGEITDTCRTGRTGATARTFRPSRKSWASSLITPTTLVCSLRPLSKARS